MLSAKKIEEKVMIKKSSREVNLFLQVIRTGIFITLFLPLLVNQNLIFPFVVARTIVFRIVIEILLALYLVLCITEPRYRVKWSNLLGFLAGFTGVMIITALIGPNWYRSFWGSLERSEGILTWLHFLAFFIISVGVFKTRSDWLQLFKLAIVAGWLQTLFCLGQIFNWPLVVKTAGERIAGTIGNPSLLASYLIFIIFIASFLLEQTKSRLVRLGYWLLIILNLLVIWKTQVRGAVLALVAGFIFFVGVKLWQAKKPWAKVVLVFIPLLLVIIAYAVVVNKEAQWVKSSPTLHRLALISTVDKTSQNRLIVWQVGWQGFLERPVAGWGWENFYVPFNKYFDPVITRNVGSHPWYDRAHNMVIEVMVATGIVGLVLYLAIFGWMIKLIWQSVKFKHISQTSSLILISLIIVYFFQNLFLFDTFNSYLMFFLLLSFVQVQLAPRSRSEMESGEENLQQKNGNILGLGLIFLIIFSPGIYYFNLRPLLGNKYTVDAVVKNKTNPTAMLSNFRKAFEYAPPASQELRFILVQYTRDQVNLRGLTQETIPLVNFAIEEMNRSIQADPFAIQNYLLLSELYLAARPLNPAYLEAAENVALAALERAPQRYQTYTILGRIKIIQGKFSQGIDYFEQAVELNEKMGEAHWNLAVAYILSGQPELAQGKFDQVMGLGFNIYTPANISKLLEAYRDSKDLDATIAFVETLVSRFPQESKYQELLEALNQVRQQMIEQSQ